MHFTYLFSILSLSIWSSVSALATGRYEEAEAFFLSERRSLVRREDTTVAPSCASSCLQTYTPVYCGSNSTESCVCSDTNFITAISACAYAPCNNTELLQLQRYAAVTCGVKNDKSNINQVLLMDYTLPLLTTIFVVGRVSARIILGVGLGYDDWVMISAYIFYLITVSTSLGLVLNNFGEHTFWLSTDQVITSLKFFFYTELFYMLSITLTKLSLLLFFLRIFPSQRLLQVSWILGVFIVISNLAILLALALQCMPFSAYWTNWMYRVPPVKCIDQFAVLNVAAGLGIIHNLAILVLPIPTLWSLNLPWQRRFNLLVMFSIGSVVVVFSCLRLPSLAKLKGSHDVSYDQAPIIVWSHLEQAIGLITACLPACRSLLEHFIPALKMSHTSTGNKTNGTVYPGAGSKHAALGTSARSFIELPDRISEIEHSSRESGDSEKGAGEMTLQEILAGAPNAASKANRGGCKKMGFGHETRVAGGGKNLPESTLVPKKVLEERERRSGGKSSEEQRSGDREHKRDEIGIAVLGVGDGEMKEGGIMCTKTIEYTHEKL